MLPRGQRGAPRSCRRLERHHRGDWEQRRGSNWGQLPLVFPWWLKALTESEELRYSPSPPLTGGQVPPSCHHIPAGTLVQLLFQFLPVLLCSDPLS